MKSRRSASCSAVVKCDAVGVAAVAVGGVGAEGGDFDLAGSARAENGDHAERGADRRACGGGRRDREFDRAWRWWRRRNLWA